MEVWQSTLLVIVFFLVMFLGMQIQIQGLSREVDDLKKKRDGG